MVAVAHRGAVHVPPLPGCLPQRCRLPMRGPGLGEVFRADDALQRRCQHARRQRSLGVSLLCAAGAQPSLRHTGDDARYIASTANAESRKASEYLQMTPDEGHRRRRAAKYDHVVTRLGLDHPPSVGTHRTDRPRALSSEHRGSVRRVGALLSANR